MSQWGSASTEDGMIDADEFIDFYRSVSGCVGGDEAFADMMKVGGRHF
jgi:hypothetical protein